ncbi:MAG: molecular chaperone HtpG [Caldilineales bacterium]|nr:molecular chaperone HtpG [Caldilineales bacterium]
MTTETQTFQAEVRKLLDILIHSLYTDREIFLRELISNASDALHRLKFEMLTNPEVRDPDIELAIRIDGDPDNLRLTISDSGIGMTRDELAMHLGTIAHSGAEAFMRSLDNRQAADQIGQFGVGFYSVFMVAEEVRVTSLSYRPDAQAWTWISRGEDSYWLEPGERSERGTTIEIKLKEEAREFAERSRLIGIIHQHSDFVSFPIYVNSDAANRQTALWRQSASELSDEAANEFYKQLTFDPQSPLLHVRVNTDAPVQIYALLYIPSHQDYGLFGTRQDFGLKLYSHKIRIQTHNKELLPNYLRFVEGVVDSDDIKLNVSRETVQSDPAMRRIKKVLGGRVFDALEKLAKEDAERYATFWAAFGVFIKEGLASEFDDRERLLTLLRFYSSRSGEKLASLSDYVSRMAAKQRAIYYIVGDDLETIKRSPHLDYFRKEGLEVLYLVDALDGFLPSALREYEGFQLQNVDDAGLDLPGSKGEKEGEEEGESPSDERIRPLIDRVKAQLGDRVVDVHSTNLLVEHPARLVSPAGSFGSEMDRVRRLLDQDYETPRKTLELNPGHPLVTGLAELAQTEGHNELVAAAIEQLFDNCLLSEGLHPNPATMVDRIQVLMEAALGKA